MPDIDELLQLNLEALENGTSLEQLLAELPAGEAELASLLRLASAIRSLPDVAPASVQARPPEAVQPPVVHVHGNGAKPDGKTLPHLAMPHFSDMLRQNGLVSQQDAASTRPSRAPKHRTAVRELPLRSFGVLALGMFALFLLAAAGVWLAGPPGADRATLIDLNGKVQIASRSGEDWWAASTGERLATGQTIRTGPNSEVTLLFFDGTRTIVGSDAELTLTEVSGGWGDALRVEMAQASGKTSNSVIPLRGKNSKFIVQAPSGTVSVHGTSFDVLVTEGGKSRFAVASGKVQINAGASAVDLLSGQVTTAQVGEEPEPPAYRFSVQGILSADLGNVWVVADVPFTINEDTVLEVEPKSGTNVFVDGHVQTNGEWVADQISAAPSDVPVTAFAGVVEALDASSLTVNSWTVAVTPKTNLPAGLKVGDRVQVQFTLMGDGRWEAANVTLLDVSPEPPDQEPDPQAQPVLAFTPNELEGEGCQNGQITFNGSVTNMASDPEDAAADVRLGFEIKQGAEQIESIELTPIHWEMVPAGEQVDFAIKVTPEQGWCLDTLAKELKIQVFVASERNRPASHRERLSLRLSGNTQPEETTTPTASSTATATPTITPGLEGKLDDPVDSSQNTTWGVTDCTGAQPHPTGTKLAQRYGVKYEEIMNWFCQGYGFGEIDLAYSLSEQSGWPVTDIFALRQSGMGWGEIKKLVEAGGNGMPVDQSDDNDNGKKNKDGNKKGNGNKGKPNKKP